MIQRRCNNCGAPLKQYNWNNWTCEYCGSIYQEEHNNHITTNYSYYGNTAIYADYNYIKRDNNYR